MDEAPPSDYGVLERDQVDGVLAVHAERIRVAGYSIIADAFTPEEIAHLGDRLDAVLERQAEEFGAARMMAIGDSGTARLPLAYDDVFLKPATHPRRGCVAVLTLTDVPCPHPIFNDS